MNRSGSSWTRRSFLQRIGQLGGTAALFESMTAMGMINRPRRWDGPPKLIPAGGNGSTVLILGTGIGGLTAAYELGRAGYHCIVLEAQDRAGGRNFTARRGSTIVEQGEQGRTEQTCRFDDGLYLNMGPGRLPYHHRRVLHYCRELGVDLEVYVMNTTANLFQSNNAFDGQAVSYRSVANDTRGYLAELLARAVREGALNRTLDEGDRENLLELLRTFGDLGNGCDDYVYCGSSRSGCARPETVYESCDTEFIGEHDFVEPLGLQSLLQSGFWNDRFYQPVDFQWQPTLFQPVGGMDKIVDGFMNHVGDQVRLNHIVREINLTEHGVTVAWTHGQTGESGVIGADYCISNIPLPVLHQIPVNFSEDYQAAVARGRFAPTCKVGWQANERFWESDRYQIYGGISWIDHNMTQMWYPSNGYHPQDLPEGGTLTGAYNFGSRAIALGRLPLADRLVLARQGAIRLHPEFEDESIVPTALGLSIAWHQIPFQLGGWSYWQDTAEEREAYARLLAPDKDRFFMVGDQVSSLPGWQEGAIMSAQHVCEQLTGVRSKAVVAVDHVPNSQKLVEGRW